MVSKAEPRLEGRNSDSKAQSQRFMILILRRNIISKINNLFRKSLGLSSVLISALQVHPDTWGQAINIDFGPSCVFIYTQIHISVLCTVCV